MNHSFNIEIAKKLGIAPAVIFNNLRYWIEKNKANGKHFYDGYYWTYNSMKAYVLQFPYLTERQIDYALKKLIKEGYIITGNYNKASFDRTLWYAITQKGYCILQNCEMEETNLGNAINENVKAIPDINTDNKSAKDPLPTVKGEKTPLSSMKKKSYREVYDDPENQIIREALVKFVDSCKGRNYTPKVTTVEKFAKTLRENSHGNPELAMRIVDQSISKGWKDLYPLKEKFRAGAVSKKFTGETAKDEAGNEIVY